MTIEQNLESIAKSLATIAQVLSQSTPMIVDAAPAPAPAPAPAKAPKLKAVEVVAPAPTPEPAPAPEPTPAPATAKSVMFPDFDSVLKYTMETVGKKPEASAHIGDVLMNHFNVTRLGDLKPEQYDAYYERLEAL